MLIDLWGNLDGQRSEVPPILKEKELSRKFTDFNFASTSRFCNRVVHKCAKQVSCVIRCECCQLTEPLWFSKNNMEIP